MDTDKEQEQPQTAENENNTNAQSGEQISETALDAPELIAAAQTPALAIAPSPAPTSPSASPSPAPTPAPAPTTFREPATSNNKSGGSRPFSEAVFHIEINKIKPNPYQPRRDFGAESLEELAASIREFGILQPLIVSKTEKETDFGADVEYQLIAGERRWRAAKMLGLERVPAIVKGVARDVDSLEMAIVENLQRENLNPIETARAYAKLQDVFGLTQREIAVRVSKSRETVANSLRLLNLPKEIQDAVADAKINESQGRLLLTIKEPAAQIAIFNDLLANNLSVRELRGRINKEKPQKTDGVKTATGVVDSETLALEEKLTEILSAPVKIEKTPNGGKIVISFYSEEELRGMINKFDPEAPASNQTDL